MATIVIWAALMIIFRILFRKRTSNSNAKWCGNEFCSRPTLTHTNQVQQFEVNCASAGARTLSYPGTQARWLPWSNPRRFGFAQETAPSCTSTSARRTPAHRHGTSRATRGRPFQSVLRKLGQDSDVGQSQMVRTLFARVPQSRPGQSTQISTNRATRESRPDQRNA